ncbi:MAG TPA: Uma2 family endonuclease [Minicystis sp.]|nr:Uma2 family endonuclease [Minicystis sp.]
MTAASPTRCTFEEYLRAEVDSEDKHEWCDGVVYAMSRGTPEHARLSARVVIILGNALGRDCTVFSADLMLYVESARLSTYADASVVCGSLETKSVKQRGRTIGEAVTNPVVIVEVLSDSTERYDRDGKFQAYKGLASLEEYVLVSQYEARVEVYRRRADGSWSCDVAERGGSVTVHGARVGVDDVYGEPRRE